MGWLDLESVAAVRRHVLPGSAALDIGAHAGYYSLLLSRLVGPRGTVAAFEPDPVNYRVLTSNLQARGAWNVLPQRAAVSDHRGSITLYRSAGSGNHSLFQYTPAVDHITVDTLSIDDYVEQAGIGAVSFAKIDVEGAEPLVLAGMRKTIRRSPSMTILIEYNPRALRSGGTEPPELLEMLREAGFELWELHHGQAPRAIGPSGGPDDRSASAINILCARNRP